MLSEEPRANVTTLTGARAVWAHSKKAIYPRAPIAPKAARRADAAANYQSCARAKAILRDASQTACRAALRA